MSEAVARLKERIARLPVNSGGVVQALVEAGANNVRAAPASVLAGQSKQGGAERNTSRDTGSLSSDNAAPASVRESPQGDPSPYGGPQGDRLKELLLPFQPWPVALALDAAGQIQVRASRLLLEPMREYCEQHGPELKAFLESCPGHTWSTMRRKS